MSDLSENLAPLGFAIAGTGAIAAVHAQALQHVRGARLLAAYDSCQPLAKGFTEKYGLAAYDRFEVLLANPAIDAVILCTPSGARHPLALAAAAAGKHVVCEKPVEVTLARIDDMIAACARSGVALACILNNRYNPVYRRVKRTVSEGKLGRVLLADAYVKWFRSREYYEGSPWRGTWALDGGGALMNQSIHFVDLLQWIAGPVAEVKAFTATNYHPGLEVEDTATAALRFACGALGVIEGTTAAVPGLHDRLEVHGENGSILVEDGRIARWSVQGDPMPDAELAALNDFYMGNAAAPMAIDERLHRGQLQDTVDALRAGRPVPVDGAEARKAVEIIMRIYQSAGRVAGEAGSVP